MNDKPLRYDGPAFDRSLYSGVTSNRVWNAYPGALLTRPTFLDRDDIEAVETDIDIILSLLLDLPSRLDGGNLSAFDRRVGFSEDRVHLTAEIENLEAPRRIARADLLRSEEGFRMVELNVSSALCGMEIAELNRLLLQDATLQAHVKDHGLDFIDPVAILVAYLRENFGANLGTVALVDTASSFSQTKNVLEVLAGLLGEQGIDAVATHLGALSCGDRVEVAGRQINVVYRFLTLSELVVDENTARASAELLSALSLRGVPVVSPLSTSCFGNKRSLAMLWSSKAQSTMTTGERHAVERLIPWTVPLDIHQRGSADDDKLFRRCVSERKSLVLKPAFGAKGHGVIIGSETDQNDWERKLSVLNPAKFVIQRSVSPVDEYFKSSEGEWTPWRLNYGFFHFGHSFGGAKNTRAPCQCERRYLRRQWGVHWQPVHRCGCRDENTG